MSDSFYTGYNGNSIHVAVGSQKYRMNVAQYLGFRDVKGISNQLFELIDNSIDESLEIFNQTSRAYKALIEKENLDPTQVPPLEPFTIRINIDSEYNVTISDEGRGLPCAINEQLKLPAIYAIFEHDSAGGKGRHSQGGYSTSTSGMHGAGACVSQACTTYFQVRTKTFVHSDPEYSGEFAVAYENGERKVDLNKITDTVNPHPNEIKAFLGLYDTGTTIKYHFDPTVFDVTENGMACEPYNKDQIVHRLRTALMGIQELDSIRIEFTFKDDPTVIISPHDVSAEKILQVSDEGVFTTFDIISNKDPKIKGYFKGKLHLYHKSPTQISISNSRVVVNRLVLEKEPFTRIVRTELRNIISGTVDYELSNRNVHHRTITDSVVDEYVSRYVFMLVLDITDPAFGGQTKNNLTSTDCNVEFKSLMMKQFLAIQDLKSICMELADIVVEKIKQQKKLDEIKQRELKRQEKQRVALDINAFKQSYSQGVDTSASAFGARISQSLVPARDSFLVIVEGISAGSSIKVEVDRNMHVLTLGGKPSNVYKCIKDRTLDKHKGTLETIITALAQNYKYITILTDADADAVHIKILLYAVIFYFAKEYLYEGRVFTINSPHAKIKNTTGKPIEIDLSNVPGSGVKSLTIPTSGNFYTVTQTETDLAVSQGATIVKRYSGLEESLTDDNGITFENLINDSRYLFQVSSPTDEDILNLLDVLNDDNSYNKTVTGLANLTFRASEVYRNSRDNIISDMCSHSFNPNYPYVSNPEIINNGYYSFFTEEDKKPLTYEQIQNRMVGFDFDLDTFI